MRVSCNHKMWEVADIESFNVALDYRDDLGGGNFWITPDDDEYPVLGVRVCREIADVSYLPCEGDAGFRCLGGEGLPEDGSTLLVYRGADPADGELTPNDFIVPFETARSIARVFFETEEMSEAVSWLDLDPDANLS